MGRGEEGGKEGMGRERREVRRGWGAGREVGRGGERGGR